MEDFQTKIENELTEPEYSDFIKYAEPILADREFKTKDIEPFIKNISLYKPEEAKVIIYGTQELVDNAYKSMLIGISGILKKDSFKTKEKKEKKPPSEANLFCSFPIEHV